MKNKMETPSMKNKNYWVILLMIGLIIFLFNSFIGFFTIEAVFILALIEVEKDRKKKITSIAVLILAIIVLSFIFLFYI